MSEEDLKRLQVYADEIARGDSQVTVSCDEAVFLRVTVTKESGGSQPLSMTASIKFSNLTEARRFIARVIEQARRAGADL